MANPEAMGAVDWAKVREWLRDTSGYDILAPRFFEEMGFRREWLPLYQHHSGEGKHAITRPDGTVGDVTGVSEFAMASRLCRALSLGDPGAHLMGRGSAFRERSAAILRWISEHNPEGSDAE